MLTSALMAGLHHILAFLTVALLAAEFALLRPGLTRAQLKTLGHIDLAYGLVFAVLLGVGITRGIWFEKGFAHYIQSPAFLAKFALLLVIAGLSIPPTVAYIRWSRATADPAPADIIRLRRFLWAEAALLIPVPILAALMARGM